MKKRFQMNLHLFGHDPAGGGSEPATPPAGNQSQQQTPSVNAAPEFDYEKLAQLVAGGGKTDGNGRVCTERIFQTAGITVYVKI